MLDQGRMGTLVKGGCNKIVTINPLTREGHKKVAGNDLPTVNGKARDRKLGCHRSQQLGMAALGHVCYRQRRDHTATPSAAKKVSITWRSENARR